MIHTPRIARIVLLFLGMNSLAVAEDQPRVIWAEKFGAPLDSGWSWLREEPKGWKVEEGTLQILTLPGHVFTKHNDARNLLLRKAPEISQPWAVEVWVENRPKNQYEEAGLLWYYDDDNYVILAKENVGAEVRVRMILEKAATPTFRFEKKYETDEVWFRLLVGGGKAMGYYRPSAQELWQKMGQVDLPAQGQARVGLNAAGGPKETDRRARFRDFRILEHAE